MPERVHPIEYGRQHGRRRGAKLCVAAIVLLTAAVVGSMWGRPYIRQAAYLYRQERCLAHALPPDAVVFEGDPSRAAILINGNASYYALRYPSWPTGGRPKGWGTPAFYFPSALDGGAAVGWSKRFFDGVAFLHERETAAGLRRLVVVTIEGTSIPQSGQRVGLVGRTFAPVSWQPGSRMMDPPRILNCEVPQFLRLTTKPDTTLRILAGQPDPADPSHFTIRYEIAGVFGTIDGWLRDPGALKQCYQQDAVELRHRDGPAVVPKRRPFPMLGLE